MGITGKGEQVTWWGQAFSSPEPGPVPLEFALGSVWLSAQSLSPEVSQPLPGAEHWVTDNSKLGVLLKWISMGKTSAVSSFSENSFQSQKASFFDWKQCGEPMAS